MGKILQNFNFFCNHHGQVYAEVSIAPPPLQDEESNVDAAQKISPGSNHITYNAINLLFTD